MRYAVVDSGLGLLGCAAALLDADPAAELVLALDPDGMPYGARTADDVTARVRALCRAAAAHDPDVIVVACNTASVHALDAVRADHEPGVPVVGTVPAIKPAAATGRPIAVWATAVTTGSAYQRDLIARYAPNVPVAEVACVGLAEAVERADATAVARAIAAAAAATPPEVSHIVLGCTHYPLVSGDIVAALGRPVTLHDSSAAVAAQAMRRIEPRPADPGAGQRLVAVIESGRPAPLPPRVLAYPAGRRVAAVATLARDRPADRRGDRSREAG